MKKKLILTILITLLFVPIVKAEYEISAYDIPEKTYIIGNYMFTRVPSEATGYDGKLTTKRMLLAAKTISGTTEADMIVYYKTVTGIWIDGITGETIAQLNDPEDETMFTIKNVDLQAFDGTRVLQDTKTVNGKTVNIEYRLETLDDVSAELYINNTKIADFNVYSCGTGACHFEENLKALNEFKVSDVKTEIINGDKEYLYFELSLGGTPFNAYSIIVINDSGTVLLNEDVSPTPVFDNCSNKAFFESALPVIVERGTVDTISYAKNINGGHIKKLKATFANDQANISEEATCTAILDWYSNDADFSLYNGNMKSKVVSVNDREATLTYAYYDDGDKTMVDLMFRYNDDDWVVGDVILYSTTDPYIKSNYDKYDFGIIKGANNYVYLKEYKDDDVNIIIILADIDSDESYAIYSSLDYYIMGTEDDPYMKFKVGSMNEGIYPRETHENYAKYMLNEGEGYYVDNDAIYYLESIDRDTANEYKVSVGSDGKIVKTKIGVVPVYFNVY